MKVLFLALFFVVGVQSKVTFSNCGNPLVKLDKLEQIPEEKTLNDKTKISLRYTSTSDYMDPKMKATITVNISRWLLVAYLPVPDLIFDMIAPAVTTVIPGVKYLGSKKFEVGCTAAGKFMKQCPPKKGVHDVDIDLGTMLKDAKAKAGTVASYFASGYFRINADAQLKNGKQLACLSNIEFKLEL